MQSGMDTFTDDGEAGEEGAAFLSAIAEAEADGLRRLSQEGGDSRRRHERQHAEPAESVSSSLHSSYNAGHGDHGHSSYDKEAASKRSRLEPEGDYMAALRGTHSETWQAMTSKARPDVKPRYGAVGKEGHWARDFPSKSINPNPWGPDNTSIPGQAQVPERSCSCGGGVCKVLTANTEKNAGRQFYRCPLRKEEGQCGFFEWCDGSTSTSQGLSKGRGDSHTHPEFPCPCGAGVCFILTAKTEKNMGRQFYRCPLNQGEGSCGLFKWCDEALPASSTPPAYGGGSYKERVPSHTHPEFPCPCGAGVCSILTAKTEKNMGRQFYRCPLNQGEGSCGFFKWCDEALPASSTPPAYGGGSYKERVPMSNAATGQCYKCGLDGHWAKDCSSTVQNNTPKGFGSTMRSGQVGSGAMGTCYKCEQVGHWAKDCPNQQFSGALGGLKRETNFSRGFQNASGYGSPGAGIDMNTIGTAGSGGCFKCGSQGHWSKDCPSARPNSYGGQLQGSSSGRSAGGSGGSGSCNKCGGQGHWANECRSAGKGRSMY